MSGGFVLLISGDLNVAAGVRGATQASGHQLVQVHAWTGLETVGVDVRPTLVIADLSQPGINVRQLVDWLNAREAPRPKVIAFGPHVQEDLLAAAQEAGCDEVYSRGGFFKRLEAIIRQDAPA